MGYEIGAGAVGKAIGTAIQNFGNHSAQAAARANGVSAAAQAAQGNFNQASANNANAIGTDRIAEQYAFNAAQAAAANNFSEQMWNRSAEWNETMWEKQAEFNREEAQKNRDWQERMMSTAYQRATTDMKAAGLNPVLAVTGGGISTGSGSGSAASVGSTSMSAPSGQAASGGLMSAAQASEGNYSGQMEYMGGMLGLLSAAISGISTALQSASWMGEQGGSFISSILDIIQDGGFIYDKKENEAVEKYGQRGSQAEGYHNRNNHTLGGSSGSYGTKKKDDWYYKQ